MRRRRVTEFERQMREMAREMDEAKAERDAKTSEAPNREAIVAAWDEYNRKSVEIRDRFIAQG